MSFKPKVVGDFKGTGLDDGAALLREADRLLDLTRRLAACFTDYRSQRRVEHPVRLLVAQRLSGFVLGYENLNDHAELRDASLLALVVGDLTGEASGARSRPPVGQSP